MIAYTTIGTNDLDSGDVALTSKYRIQFGQPVCQVNCWNELQLFPIEQPKQHLQDVLSSRILAGIRENTSIEFWRRIQQLAGVERATFSRPRSAAPPASPRCTCGVG